MTQVFQATKNALDTWIDIAFRSLNQHCFSKFESTLFFEVSSNIVRLETRPVLNQFAHHEFLGDKE